MDLATKLITGVSHSCGVKLVTQEFLMDLMQPGVCKVTHLSYGGGEVGGKSECMRVEGDNCDWILRFHVNSVPTLIDKIRCMSSLAGIPGVEVMVGVCPEMRVIITEYGGENLRNILENTDTLKTDFLLRVMHGLTLTVYTLTSRGVYHNDIRSKNVCIVPTCDGPKVTLINFDLCTSLKPLCSGECPFDESEACDARP